MKRICLVLSLLGGLTPIVQAKLYIPQSLDKFFLYVNTRHRVGIAHFNPFPPEEVTPELELMKEAFVELSREERYRTVDMSFVGVSLPELPELADLYNIPLPMEAPIAEATEEGADDQEVDVDKDEKVKVVSDMNDLPKSDQSTLILFKDGKPFKRDGKIIKAEGILSKREMRDFIEDNLGSFIDTLMLERQQQDIRQQQELLEARQRQLAQQQAQQKEVVYQPQRTRYVYYPGRPYYGGYWRRRYWGGYPYRRRWWGPGFGVGFGFGRGYRRRGWGGFGIGFGW